MDKKKRQHPQAKVEKSKADIAADSQLPPTKAGPETETGKSPTPKDTPESKPAPKAEAKPEPTAEPKVDADSEPTPAPKVEAKPAAPSRPRAKKTKNSSSWKVRLSILIAIILALLSLGAAYWLYTQLQLQIAANANAQQKSSQALVGPKQQIMELEKRQLNASAIQEKMSILGENQSIIQQRIMTLSQRNPNHWLATEADYLVRMAGRKLWLEKDPQTAAGLLKAADNRIAAMQEPGLTNLRRKMAKDIAKVSAIKGTDVTGTVFSIDQIIASLDKLPLIRNEAVAEQMKVESDKPSQSMDDWRQNLAKTWKAVTEDFITVRHRTTDLAPLLEPNQEWYLIENIRNKLLQSELALYQFDEVNYRQSLKMARKWIHQYFDIEAQETKDALAALDALATLKITTISIEKFESTAQLKQLITYGEVNPIEEGEL